MKGSATFSTVVGLVLLLTLGPVAFAQAPKAEAKPAAPASAPKADKADRHAAVQKALDTSASAVRRGDYQAAIDAATEAVELDPTDPVARIHRANLLQHLRGSGTSEEINQRMEKTLREDYRAASEADPDSTAAGVARDSLADLEGHPLFPPVLPACSKEALAELDAAEDLFVNNHLKDSLEHYEKAAQGCPTDPTIWTHYGDAYYALDDFAQARSRFEKALAQSPWHAQAHRFLADTLVHQGQLQEAYHEAVLAVLSNPTYEAGWGGLHAYVTIPGRGGTWNRAYGAKPEVKPGEKGELNLNFPPKGPGSSEWTIYAIAKGLFLLPPQKGAPPPPKTALDREREAIRRVLQNRKELAASSASGASGGKPPAPSRFWDMMVRADQAGFLDEAIFVHLLDSDLLPEYLTFRDKHRDRLVRYVETVLAPLPPRPALPGS